MNTSGTEKKNNISIEDIKSVINSFIHSAIDRDSYFFKVNYGKFSVKGDAPIEKISNVIQNLASPRGGIFSGHWHRDFLEEAKELLDELQKSDSNTQVLRNLYQTRHTFASIMTSGSDNFT